MRLMCSEAQSKFFSSRTKMSSLYYCVYKKSTGVIYRNEQVIFLTDLVYMIKLAIKKW